MAMTVKTTEGKKTPSKKNITLKDIIVSELTFVDIDGVDLTEDFVNAVPEGIEMIDLKVSFELPDED